MGARWSRIASFQCGTSELLANGASNLGAALQAVAGARAALAGLAELIRSPLREHRRQAARGDLEKLISDLSVAFATVTPDRVERDIEQALGRLLCALGVGRVSFYQFSPEGRMRLFSSATAPGLNPTAATFWNEEFPWFTGTLAAGRIVRLGRLPHDYPVEAGNERAAAQRDHARAELAIPLRVAGKIAAAISFVDFRAPRNWPEQALVPLRTVGEILAHALVRQAAAEEAVERLRFERLLADLSATFANLQPDCVDAEIRLGLQRLLTFLGLDRAGFLEVRREGGCLRVLHEVAARADGRCAETPWEQLPWWADQLRRGEVLAWSNLPEDLPGQALHEREYVLHEGMRAALTIPLHIGGALAGAICICDMSRSRQWNADLVVRLRTLGEIFASALERRASGRALAARLEFEGLLADLSATFANLDVDRVEQEIGNAMRRVLEALNVDRCGFIVISKQTGRLQVLHAVTRDSSVPPFFDNLEEALPWWAGRLHRGEPVIAEDTLEDVPLEAREEHAYYKLSGLRAILTLPLRVGGRVEAAIGLSDFRGPHRWPPEVVARLQALGGIFVNALQRKSWEKEVAARLKFETLVADLSATFANLPLQRLEQEIEKSLRRLLEVLDLDRCGFMEISREHRRLRVIHSVTRDKAVPPFQGDIEEDFPWWSSRVHRGEIVAAEDVRRDIPAEAVKERAYYERIGLQASLTIPLRVGGKVTAAIGFSGFRSTRPWPAELIARLQTLGGIFATAVERKAAEEQLRDSEALNNAVLASLPGFVAIVDQDGAIIGVNRAWGRLPERIHTVGGYAAFLQSATGAGELHIRPVVEALDAVLAERESRTVIEFQCPGEGRWFEVRIEPLNRAEGGAVISHMDVTARKRSEAQARRAQEQMAHLDRVAAMGELASSLAHELSQPLTAILSNAQAARNFLDEAVPDLVEVRDTLDDIIRNDTRAGEVIRRMRALLKRSEFRPVALNLNELVREVVRMVGPDALLKKSSIQMHVQPDLPLVSGDAVQMQQVLINLLLNGLDAVVQRPQGSRWIRIGTRVAVDHAVELTVEDSGNGIAEKDLERVFEPFFTTKREGLGMGLSISRSIVELHAGSIKAEQAPAGGALFRCLFKVAPAAARGIEDESGECEHGSHRVHSG